MGAKRIQVSADGGTTWRTMPGSSGEFNEDVSTNNDTVFGQSFQSDEVSISGWEVMCNAYMKNVVGYAATLKQGATPVVMTTEAMTLVSGKTYQITASTKRIIDYFTAITVFDNAVDHTADVESIDYLNGLVTFLSSYTVTGPVTITGKYVPTSVIAKGRSFTLTQNANAIDTTTYEAAQANGGWRTHKPGLRTVSLEVNGLYDITNGAAAAIRGKQPIIVDISPDGSSTTMFRGFFKRHSRGQSGEVGALEEEKQQFGLWVPDGGLVVAPFRWYFGSGSIMNLASKDIINAWQNETLIKVRYQDDPDVNGSGHFGDAVVTEFSLSNTFEGLNEFRAGFRGSGTPTAV